MICIPTESLCKLLKRVKDNDDSKIIFYRISNLSGVYLSALVTKSINGVINQLYLIDPYFLTSIGVKRLLHNSLVNIELDEEGVRCYSTCYQKEVIPLYMFKESSNKYYRILLNIIVMKWGLLKLRCLTSSEGIKDVYTALDIQIENLSIKLEDHIENHILNRS